MDGSPAGYYLQQSPCNASSCSSDSKWVIELQGGGECASAEECDEKQGTPLASSRFFGKREARHAFRFLLDGDAAANPELSQWNRVHVPCIAACGSNQHP